MKEILIVANNHELIVELENNSSADTLYNRLQEGSVIVSAHDYGNMEKVGNLEFNLPTNDTTMTTNIGDVILYQGNQITIYYDNNTWSLTKLGHIKNITQEELKNILGPDDVELEFKLKK